MFKDARLEEVRRLLIDSMFMLEMIGEGNYGYTENELIDAGHSMTQRALGLLCGRADPPSVTPRGLEILAIEQAKSAIEDAREISKHG